MKKLLILTLFAATLTACKKNQPTIATAPLPANKIAGKWTINSVTVIPRDSTGKPINSGTVYPEPAYYYFQFNANNTWVENLSPDTSSGLGESGSYVLHADTAFTLLNKNLPANPVECHIVSLTGKSLIFTHQKATLFNGVTRGYLEYLFDLKK